MSDRVLRLAVPLAAFFLGLVVLGVAVVLTVAPSGQRTASAVGGAFRLVDQDGRVVTEQDFRGKPHLVFFGFTHCPDVCPTTLFQISEVLRATGEKGRGLRAVFITVDPEQDTPAAMKSYLASFDDRIVGLTGDPPAVEAAVRAFKAYARKIPLKDGGYTMEHTSLVYLMDGKGRFVKSFNLNQTPEAGAQELLDAS